MRSLNVIIAMDSFKGSLSSIEAGEAVKAGINDLVNTAEVYYVADGGEGSVEAVKWAAKLKSFGDEFNEVSINTLDALKRPIKASYLLLNNLCVLEMASSCGLAQLKEDERNPLKTSTYGVGLMIKDALNRGARKFIIGIGGSATNDAGVGMLEALGFCFLNKEGEEFSPLGGDLADITKIKGSSLEELRHATFDIACDVNNELYGENGAAYVYARQKGANDAGIKHLDDGLRSFARVVTEFNLSDYSKYAGAGASGGLGYAFKSFFNATLKPGFEIISELSNLEERMESADIMITGEGRFDYQSAMGKLPSAIGRMAKKHGLIVIVLAGSIGDENDKQVSKMTTNKTTDVEDKLKQDDDLTSPIDTYFSILNAPMNLNEAMNKTKDNLRRTARQIIKLIIATKYKGKQ